MKINAEKVQKSRKKALKLKNKFCSIKNHRTFAVSNFTITAARLQTQSQQYESK